MRWPDMTVIGIAIGTSIVPILIMVTSLFLSAVPGGVFTHGITILTTVLPTAMTPMTTHMITRMTMTGIPTKELTTPLPNRIAITMAMLSQASTVTRL